MKEVLDIVGFLLPGASFLVQTAACVILALLFDRVKRIEVELRDVRDKTDGTGEKLARLEGRFQGGAAIQ